MDEISAEDREAYLQALHNLKEEQLRNSNEINDIKKK